MAPQRSRRSEASTLFRPLGLLWRASIAAGPLRALIGWEALKYTAGVSCGLEGSGRVGVA